MNISGDMYFPFPRRFRARRGRTPLARRRADGDLHPTTTRIGHYQATRLLRATAARLGFVLEDRRAVTILADLVREPRTVIICSALHSLAMLGAEEFVWLACACAQDQDHFAFLHGQRAILLLPVVGRGLPVLTGGRISTNLGGLRFLREFVASLECHVQKL